MLSALRNVSRYACACACTLHMSFLTPVTEWLCGRVVKAQRYESARVKRRGFESRTCRNYSPQANSQLSCPSSRRSVNEYSIKFEETSRRPQSHISSGMVAKPLGVKWLKVERCICNDPTDCECNSKLWISSPPLFPNEFFRNFSVLCKITIDIFHFCEIAFRRLVPPNLASITVSMPLVMWWLKIESYYIKVAFLIWMGDRIED